MNGTVAVQNANPTTFNATLSLGKHGRLYLNRFKGWTVWAHDATPFATTKETWESARTHTPATWNVTRVDGNPL